MQLFARLPEALEPLVFEVPPELMSHLELLKQLGAGETASVARLVDLLQVHCQELHSMSSTCCRCMAERCTACHRDILDPTYSCGCMSVAQLTRPRLSGSQAGCIGACPSFALGSSALSLRVCHLTSRALLVFMHLMYLILGVGHHQCCAGAAHQPEGLLAEHQ